MGVGPSGRRCWRAVQLQMCGHAGQADEEVDAEEVKNTNIATHGMPPWFVTQSRSESISGVFTFAGSPMCCSFDLASSCWAAASNPHAALSAWAATLI